VKGELVADRTKGLAVAQRAFALQDEVDVLPVALMAVDPLVEGIKEPVLDAEQPLLPVDPEGVGKLGGPEDLAARAGGALRPGSHQRFPPRAPPALAGGDRAIVSGRVDVVADAAPAHVPLRQVVPGPAREVSVLHGHVPLDHVPAVVEHLGHQVGPVSPGVAHVDWPDAAVGQRHGRVVATGQPRENRRRLLRRGQRFRLRPDGPPGRGRCERAGGQERREEHDRGERRTQQFRQYQWSRAKVAEDLVASTRPADVAGARQKIGLGHGARPRSRPLDLALRTNRPEGHWRARRNCTLCRTARWGRPRLAVTPELRACAPRPPPDCLALTPSQRQGCPDREAAPRTGRASCSRPPECRSARAVLRLARKSSSGRIVRRARPNRRLRNQPRTTSDPLPGDSRWWGGGAGR
jgi:hypothetical protein